MAVITTSAARYAVLTADLAGGGTTSIGVLLQNPKSDELYARLRRDWELIAGEEEAEVLRLLEDDLLAKAREIGAEKLLRWLEENASGSVRITDREEAMVEDFQRGLNRLYSRHVQAAVQPFRTHLPLYTLRAAAGKFLDNAEVVEEAWLEAPAGMRLDDLMFVARVEGHSMEPHIPDGSLCVFRASVVGSRSGRLLLIENRSGGGFDRYAVKRYKSEKRSGADEWRHKRIRLESLNPDYESWDLVPEEDKYRIVAEFKQVLE